MVEQVVVIMNPWCKEEISKREQIFLFWAVRGHFKAHSIHHSRSRKHILRKVFDLLGPIPRLCADFSSYETAEYKKRSESSDLEYHG